jgi:hypothetical protein
MKLPSWLPLKNGLLACGGDDRGQELFGGCSVSPGNISSVAAPIFISHLIVPSVSRLTGERGKARDKEMTDATRSFWSSIASIIA